MSRKYKITNPEGIYFLTPTIVNWNPVLLRKEYFDIIAESVVFCQNNKQLKVHCYVFMPNHLHFILSSSNERLIETVRDFKKYTSSAIIKAIVSSGVESRKEYLLKEFAEAASINCHNKNYQFWMNHNMPKELTDNESIEQKRNYIHMNPVVAGLCTSPESYMYSSANPDGPIKIDEL